MHQPGAIMDSTPLFTRTFDFITWLMPITNHFPRSQRFLITMRLLNAALDFQELILEANNEQMPERLERLRMADAALDKVRIYLRLALKWEWLRSGQYQHAAGMVTEIGRLLGGWQRALRQSGH
jgi:four helix bundle protein